MINTKMPPLMLCRSTHRYITTTHVIHHMDNDAALRREEERLLRAISRGGSSRPPAWSSSKNPTSTPASKPLATTPSTTEKEPPSKTTASTASTTKAKSLTDDEERKKKEHEAIEREKQRERERMEYERLEKEVFERKRMFSRGNLNWIEFETPISTSQQPPEPSSTSQSKPKTVSVSSPSPTLTPTPTPSASTSTVATTKTVVTPPTVPSVVESGRSQSGWEERMDELISSLVETSPQTQTPPQPQPAPSQKPTPSIEPLTSVEPIFTQTKPSHEIAFENAKQKLSALKWQIATPLGAAQETDLVMYIRTIIEKVKKFKASTEVPINDPKEYPYAEVANSMEAFVETILGSLILILNADDRREVGNRLLALIQSTIEFIEVIYTSQNVTEAEDKMRGDLQSLVITITNSTRKQTEQQKQQEEQQAQLAQQQQERTTLIEIVQEAAKYAEKISEILKTPTAFDATLFKENLTAMVNAVKRIDPYIADENQRQKVITTTRTVLERAIEFHQSGGQSSPLPLLNSVTELLRCLTVGLQQ